MEEAQTKSTAKAAARQAKVQAIVAAKKSQSDEIHKLAGIEDQRRREDNTTDGLVEADDQEMMDVDDEVEDGKRNKRYGHRAQEKGSIVSNDIDALMMDEAKSTSIDSTDDCIGKAQGEGSRGLSVSICRATGSAGFKTKISRPRLDTELVHTHTKEDKDEPVSS